MRYINQDRLEQPPGWQAKARRAYTKAKSLSPSARQKYIKTRNDVWKDLKEQLLARSHGKCWYCESFIAATSPGDVDHYRPKNEVEKCPSHNGYWWLAFDWRNFRYSCENCNRTSTDHQAGTKGGKLSHFPLWDETRRCYDEASPDCINSEEPLLLDPVVPSDPDLLTFDETGMAIPVFSEEQSKKNFTRATTSIEIYHLNRYHLKNRRQVEICDKVKALIIEGQGYYERLYEEELEEFVEQGFDRVNDTLSDMMEEKAQYSAVARAMLNLYQQEFEWLQMLLA